jgi:hypothetical protein
LAPTVGQKAPGATIRAGSIVIFGQIASGWNIIFDGKIGRIASDQLI